MPVEDLMKDVSEDVKLAGSVNAVFGEPRTVGNTTVIPIANVRLGVGASAGTTRTDQQGQVQEGGGSGGGGVARPVAVLSVREEETRVIPVLDLTRVILSALFLGGMMTWMITRIFTGKKD